MGFTERASCRPYKNCYKNKMAGGKSRTAKNKRVTKRSDTKRSDTKRSDTKRSTSKCKESGCVNPSPKHINHPTFIYHSEHTSYTSHPEDKTPYGKRTVVNVKNGVGEKSLEVLGKNGKIIKTNTHKLKAKELSEVKQGIYVPGLWNPFA